ncbi:EAL domain-containing protein [Leucothrix sargassi]|nr:EAL domain-containing protein [Leucothrix sargassi]
MTLISPERLKRIMNQTITPDIVLLQHQLMMVLGMTPDPDEMLQNFSNQALLSLDLNKIYIDRKENIALDISACSFVITIDGVSESKKTLISQYSGEHFPDDSEFLATFEVDNYYQYCFSLGSIGYILFEKDRPFENPETIPALTEVIQRMGRTYLGRKQFLVNEKQQDRIRIMSECLQTEKRKFEHILSSISDCILMLDDDGIVHYANSAANALFEIQDGEMIDEHFKEYFRIYDVDTNLDITRVTVDKAMANGEWTCQRPVVLKTTKNKELFVRLNVKSMLEGDFTKGGTKRYFVSTFHDITESHELEKKLQWQATHDSLTGCLNRHGFSDQLNRIRAVRSPSDPLAFISVDLDRFKLINDIGGHQAGDAILRQVVQLMERDIAGQGLLARLGGDEFAVILTNDDANDAELIAESIRHSIDRLRFKWEENIFTIGASLGLAHIAKGEKDINEVFIRADEACLLSKENGRNQVTIAPILNGGDEKTTKIPHEFNRNYLHHINRALAGSDDDYELVLYKQSIQAISDNSDGDHHEILLRLLYKSMIIPPDTFLPAAERSGIVREIDLFVLEKTLEHIRGHICGHYNINLSGVSLSDDITRKKIFNLISKYPDEAKSICLEVTETAAITNLTKCITFMEELSDLGVSFALDDFGTGVSSFSYLKSLPVKYLKIDGSFIRDICNNEIDEIVVQSIVSASKAMNISTVAEYVSDEAILKKVTALGIDYAQGYWMNMPTRLS